MTDTQMERAAAQTAAAEQALTDRRIDRLAAFCVLAGVTTLSICILAGVITGTW
jgi:hypothetical protein